MNSDALESPYQFPERIARQAAISAFWLHYEELPTWLVSAPGRVNLLGDLIDFNDGCVLSMPINRSAWIALRPTEDSKKEYLKTGIRRDRWVDLQSLGHESFKAEFSLDEITVGDAYWIEFVKGIAWAMQSDELALKGWEGVLASDIPQEIGLSSSSALEICVTRAFTSTSNIKWDPSRMARLAYRAENEWVMSTCGLTDPYISAAARPGQAALIDCGNLNTKYFALPADIKVVIIDTDEERNPLDIKYNQRIAEYKAIARALNVKSLRNVSLGRLTKAKRVLGPVLFQRARHIITENQRVLSAAKALKNGDTALLGQLMNESHVSFRDDFDTSWPKLDLTVEIAQQHQACLGIRMSGVGWGGCAVAIVEQSQVNQFCDFLGMKFQEVGLNGRFEILDTVGTSEHLSPVGENASGQS